MEADVSSQRDLAAIISKRAETQRNRGRDAPYAGYLTSDLKFSENGGHATLNRLTRQLRDCRIHETLHS
jgi:hypothetical protein